jgi:hypothetical protein
MEFKKAQILAKEADVDMAVCFNPKEFTLDKSASWQQGKATEDEPIEVFSAPSPATMSVTLMFDTYEDPPEGGKPVSVYTKYTSNLEKLIYIIGSNKKRPPLTRFIWGRFCFVGIVESLSQKFTMFLGDGTPVRCECTLKMKAARDAEAKSLKPKDDSKEFHPHTNFWT